MNDATPNSKRERSPLVVIAAIVMLSLPVPYVLSFGPFVWLDARGIIDKQTVHSIAPAYRPIHCLRDRSQSFRNLTDWYVDLWL